MVAAESAESIVKAIHDPSWFLRYSWLIALLPAVAAAFTLFIGIRERGNITRDRRLTKPAIPRIIDSPPPRPTRTSKGITPRPQRAVCEIFV